jgi:hypothetical protein
LTNEGDKECLRLARLHYPSDVNISKQETEEEVLFKMFQDSKCNCKEITFVLDVQWLN